MAEKLIYEGFFFFNWINLYFKPCMDRAQVNGEYLGKQAHKLVDKSMIWCSESEVKSSMVI